MSQPSGDGSTRQDQSPESESRQTSSGSSRKRASRAGTRSVNTLSAVQLERKRANDREAQRAIRQRTKETIGTLERDLSDVRAELTARDRMLAEAQTRTRQLEDENTYLRSRLGATGSDSSFMLHVSGSEGKHADSAIGVHPQSSPQPRFAGTEIQRPPSQDTRRSISTTTSHSSAQPNAWRQQQSFPLEPNPPISQRHDSAREPWRTPSEVANTLSVPSTGSHSSVDQSQRSYSTTSQAERPAWGANPSYGYMADPNQQQSAYPAANRSVPYPAPPPQQPAYSTHAALPAPTIHSTTYGPPITPSSEFQGMTLQSPASASSAASHSIHEHPSGHTSYSVSPHFQGPTSQPNIQRHPLTPTATQAYPSAGLHASQQVPMGYHGGAQNQPQFSYGQYNENG